MNGSPTPDPTGLNSEPLGWLVFSLFSRLNRALHSSSPRAFPLNPPAFFLHPRYAMKLWYNRVKAGYGNVPCCSDDDDPSTCVGTMSQCMSSTREVQDFKRTSAHELGHSVLHAFGGRTHSWWHKGSSTGAIGQNRLGGPKWQCPPPDGTGRHLDLMVYYGSSEDPPCPDRNTMSYATKWDLAKMLMASSSYSINNSP